jgi:hypothetical protein
MTVNGQAQPADDNQTKLVKMLGMTMKMVMTPTGKTTPEAETAQAFAAMMNMSGGMGMDLNRLSALTSALPDHPVKVGDTWSIADTGKLGEAAVVGSSDLKFVRLETIDGVNTARIEGTAKMSISGNMPASTPMGMPAQVNITRLDMNIVFVNHFDLDKGNLLSSKANICQSMAMMINLTQGQQAIHMPATIDNAQMTMEMKRQ